LTDERVLNERFVDRNVYSDEEEDNSGDFEKHKGKQKEFGEID
jgi:hypothetical protein